LRRRALAFGLAALVLALNVAGERIWVNAGIGPSALIPGLADIHPVFNRGVSFGLLTQDSSTGRWLLVALLGAISVGVGLMAWHSTDKLSASGYGLILGGALGNLLDRTLYGAVFDFLFLHLGAMPLFICNFSDIAISAGVVVLLLESAIVRRRSTSGLSQR
jgi:signal peptidase II